MKKYTRNKFSLILIVLLTFLVLFFSLKDNFSGVVNQLLNVNYFWILIGIILLFGYWFLRSIAMQKLIKVMCPKFTILQALKITVTTQFFDAITPSSTGGQPYQIYALKKEDIKVVDATNIVVQNFIVYQIALLILGIIAIISNNIFDIFPSSNLLKKLVTLGFIVNLLVTVILFAVAFLKNFNKKVFKIVIGAGAKLRIVKDKEKTIKKFNDYVRDFYTGARELIKNKRNFMLTIFLNILALSCIYSIPVAMLYSVGDYTSFNIYLAIITSAYVMLIGSFVPMPGGSGGLEYGFIQFYGNFLSGAKLTTIMLLWRFVTYYFGLLVGSITLNIKRKK